MDLKSVMLMLAVGSFLFGLLLVLFKFSKHYPHEVPFWIAAKMLQGTGSLLLTFRTSLYDGLTGLAYTLLLLGCAYEVWAIRILIGLKVRRHTHIATAVGVVLFCLSTVFLQKPLQSGIIFLMQGIFYLLPSIFLYDRKKPALSLRNLLSISYFFVSAVFLTAGALCVGFPSHALRLEGGPVHSAIPIVSFGIFLLSSFILLMLAIERSNMQVLQIERNLRKSEFRFQQVVETAVEGILIFDENYKVSFANNKIASVLGYTVEEMLGRPYASFFPESHLDVYHYQESLRKRGEGSVYECCLLCKDGKTHWFLVSAKAMFNDAKQFEGSFAMLTDINERKEMEMLLEESNRQLRELSNRDSLTGIANRRFFDETLEHEYYRLKRSNTMLSVILFDIDYFKEYNDFYGHVMGDECLRRVGKVLSSCISRSVDLAARYGGEEFACILPDTDLPSAVKVAEKIRNGILDLQIEHQKSPVSDIVTASFGVATVHYAEHTTLQDIIAMADKLLYRAKDLGKNRIEAGEFNTVKAPQEVLSSVPV